MGPLETLAGLFSRRFFFNALLPTLLFGSLTAGVVVLSTVGLADLSQWWNGIDLFSKTLAVVAYAGLIWFLSAAVASQWRSIVQVFEGYPLLGLVDRCNARRPRESELKAFGVRWHEARSAALWDQEVSDNAYYAYPLDENTRLLPTRLGNILWASERYATERYGINSIIFWPRLFPLLPEKFQHEYEDFLIDHEFPLVVSFEAAVATVACGATLLITGQAPGLFAAVFFGGVALAYAAYRLALSAAAELGEQTRTAFDLYRHLLMEAWKPDRDVDSERAEFTKMYQFVVRGEAIGPRTNPDTPATGAGMDGSGRR